MAQRYLLECKHCGRRWPILESQAGQTVACEGCGTTQKLGTLREIRAMQSDYQPTESTAVGVRKSASWSPVSRGMFVLGSLALVIGTLIAGYQLIQASGLDTERPVEEINPEKRKQIEMIPPAVMVNWWDRINESALETWVPHRYLQERSLARKYVAIAVIGGAVAAVGAALLFGSFLLRRDRQSVGTARR